MKYPTWVEIPTLANLPAPQENISCEVWHSSEANADDISDNFEKIREINEPIYPGSILDEMPLFNEAMQKGDN